MGQYYRLIGIYCESDINLKKDNNGDGNGKG